MEIPKSNCIKCRRLLWDKAPRVLPKKGNKCTCVYCGEVMEFDKELRLIKAKIMKPTKKVEQPSMLEVAHEMAKGLHEANVIDATTMLIFDALCLPTVKEFLPKEIKRDQNNEVNCMQYPIFIHKDKDSDYGVIVPDLEGCYSAGSSIEEAIENSHEAFECHLEGLLQDNDIDGWMEKLNITEADFVKMASWS